MITSKAILLLVFLREVKLDGNFLMYDPPILCDEEVKPDYCGFPNVSLSRMLNVEDFDNCAPGVLPIPIRNFVFSLQGRGLTYKWNMDAFKSIVITPRMFRDVSRVDISTTVLGERIAFPIGLSPTAAHKAVHPDGEIATARGMANMGTVMILSSLSTVSLEDVARAAREARRPENPAPLLWMQTYIVRNRQETLSYVRRAEKAGYKALVVTVDSPIFPEGNCAGRSVYTSGEYRFPNYFNESFDPKKKLDPSLTFRDITWLKQQTNLPIVAKGILTGIDAVRAVRAGASAILVSNHGGRQLDSGPATIEALSDVIEHLKFFPNIEVYMDGGVRNGFSVFKALERGARAVFVGRPQLWGLAIGGPNGVEKVLTILKSEFNETMILAGRRNVNEVGP